MQFLINMYSSVESYGQEAYPDDTMVNCECSDCTHSFMYHINQYHCTDRDAHGIYAPSNLIHRSLDNARVELDSFKRGK